MANRPRDERPSRAYRSTNRYIAEAKALGVRIRELRKARGWTLYQASDAMDVDLKHLQRIETGALNVTLVTLVRLASFHPESPPPPDPPTVSIGCSRA